MTDIAQRLNLEAVKHGIKEPVSEEKERRSLILEKKAASEGGVSAFDTHQK
jgi:hypothetical protein